MHSPGQHVRLRLESDRLLHCSDAQRRSLATAVHKTARPYPLLSFGCAGSHLHFVVATDHRGAGEFARRLEISLQLRHDYGSPFLRVHRRPLEDQRHAFSACLYDMRQREHHELASDPFLEATSAPDLLGARVIGAHLIPRVRERLPELRRRHLLDLFGIDDLQEAEAWADPVEVVEAVLAAFALAGLRGSSQSVRRARAVVIALVGPDLSARELAALTHCSPRTIARHRQGPPPNEHDLRAVRLQLDLRRQVGALHSDDTLE